MSKIKLGILDQSLLRKNGNQKDSFQESLATAQLADGAGYERFWVAEHHANLWFSGSNPDLLLAYIAARTVRIRLGTGGFMIANYSDYRLAETIHCLHSLIGDRLDIGLGRSAGASRSINELLMPQLQSLDVNDRMRGLRKHLSCEFPCWILNGGGPSIRDIGRSGSGLAFAHYMAPEHLATAVAMYRDHFHPGFLKKPHIMVSIRVEVSCNRLELRRSLEVSNYFAAMTQGMETASKGYPNLEQVRALGGKQPVSTIPIISGHPLQVLDELKSIQEKYGIDEFLLVSYGYDAASKLKGLDELANANI